MAPLELELTSKRRKVLSHTRPGPLARLVFMNCVKSCHGKRLATNNQTANDGFHARRKCSRRLQWGAVGVAVAVRDQLDWVGRLGPDMQIAD